MRAPADAPRALKPKGPIFSSFMRPANLAVERLTALDPAVALLDKQGIVNFSSPAMASLFKCRQNELEGREAASLFPGLPFKKHTPVYNLMFAEFWENEATWLDFKGMTPGGKRIPVEVSLKKLNVDNGQYILLGIHPAKEAGGSDEDLVRLIEAAEDNSDAVMITDTSGIIHFINHACEKSIGFTKREAIGQSANMIKSDLHDPAFYRTMWKTLLAGNDFHAVFVNRRKNGEIFHEDKHIRPFINAYGVTTHFVSTSRSLSENLRATLLRLQHEAYHDALTGLPNRTLFLDRLKHAFSRASRRDEKLSLVYIDLDNFKGINDTYGHAAGDAVLRATASCLNTSVRTDDTVARLGGDEFALILMDIHRREDVEIVLNKILSSLTQGAQFENSHIPIRASLGANVYPDDGISHETLMKNADLAMYQAKATGGHCFHFFSKKDKRGRAIKSPMPLVAGFVNPHKSGGGKGGGSDGGVGDTGATKAPVRYRV